LTQDNATSQALKWTSMAEHFEKINKPYQPLKTENQQWQLTSFNQPTTQEPLQFGDFVQIQSENNLTLTFDLWTSTFVPSGTSSSLGDKAFLLLASSFQKSSSPPCLSRTIFEIAKCPGEEYEDEVVRHGVKFRLLVPKGRFDKQASACLFLSK
jgi:hypothetical protein